MSSEAANVKTMYESAWTAGCSPVWVPYSALLGLPTWMKFCAVVQCTMIFNTFKKIVLEMTVVYPHIEFLDMHSYCFIWDVFSNLAIKKYFKIDFQKGANVQTGKQK